MKLRNKKTGKIVDVESLVANTDGSIQMTYIDEDCNRQLYITGYLKVFIEDWEDYDENKYYYAITSIKADAGITKMKNIHNDMTAFDKSIGNYFETREEAEKAVEKLKAWKRLKDNGFKFEFWTSSYSGDSIAFYIDWIDADSKKEIENDLDLLFGGEDDKK